MNNEVISWKAGWKVSTDQGRIYIKLNDDSVKRISFKEPAEFTAVVTLLETAEQKWLDDQGVLWSGDIGIQE